MHNILEFPLGFKLFMPSLIMCPCEPTKYYLTMKITLKCFQTRIKSHFNLEVNVTKTTMGSSFRCHDPGSQSGRIKPDVSYLLATEKANSPSGRNWRSVIQINYSQSELTTVFEGPWLFSSKDPVEDSCVDHATIQAKVVVERWPDVSDGIQFLPHP